MLSQDQNKLYTEVTKLIPNSVIANKNRGRTWLYGYNEKYDLVVISKTGQIGSVININGLKIALPKPTEKIYKRSKDKQDQYWETTPISKELNRVKSIFQWHETPDLFKSQWVEYIEEEFNRREQGYWFMNNGTPTYITGTHYMYLQWTKIEQMLRRCLQIR